MEGRTYNRIMLISTLVCAFASLVTLATTFEPVIRLAPLFIQDHVTFVFAISLALLVVSAAVFAFHLFHWYTYHQRLASLGGALSAESATASQVPVPTTSAPIVSPNEPPVVNLPPVTKQNPVVPPPRKAHRFPMVASVAVTLSMLLVSAVLLRSAVTQGNPLPNPRSRTTSVPIIKTTAKHPTPTKTPRVIHHRSPTPALVANSSRADGNSGNITANPDQLIGVSLTYVNTGGDSWADSMGYALICVSDSACSQLNTAPIGLGGVSVAPEHAHTFYLSFAAPAKLGVYTAAWIMSRSGTSFGAANTITITVTDTGVQSTPTPLSTDSPSVPTVPVDTPTPIPPIVPTNSPITPTFTPFL